MQTDLRVMSCGLWIWASRGQRKCNRDLIPKAFPYIWVTGHGWVIAGRKKIELCWILAGDKRTGDRDYIIISKVKSIEVT